MDKKKYCPFCGEELINGCYNSDNGFKEFVCNSCGLKYTDVNDLDPRISRIYSALESAEEHDIITPYSSPIEVDDNMFEILLFEFDECEIKDIDRGLIDVALDWYLK